MRRQFFCVFRKLHKDRLRNVLREGMTIELPRNGRKDQWEVTAHKLGKSHFIPLRGVATE